MRIDTSSANYRCYRILREEKMLKNRRPSAPPQEQKRPEGFATQPNQLWSWDITDFPTQIRGQFVYLYVCMDVFSRKITEWRVETKELGELAAELMQRTVLEEHAEGSGLCLHSVISTRMSASTTDGRDVKPPICPSLDPRFG